MYKHFLKRLLDFICSGIGIIILLPFFLILTPIIALAMRGNPFFIQRRPGKKGKIFKMIKYRTMNNQKDAEGKLLSDEDRLTKFGKMLRALSVDELPELINIFFGQMSIVGPRPLRVEYLPLYNEIQSRRHEVRPGLTGLAQVEGRNSTTWENRFARDIEYVDNISIMLDIKIFFKTILKVFKRDGISQDGNATMDYFRGNESEQEQDKTCGDEHEFANESTDTTVFHEEDKIVNQVDSLSSIQKSDNVQNSKSIEEVDDNERQY